MRDFGKTFEGPIIIEKVPELPDHNENDKSRLIFTENTDDLYLGKTSEWYKFESGTSGTSGTSGSSGSSGINGIIGKIKARAYISAEQDINAGPISSTKVRIDTISFDTEGVVDTEYSLIMPYLPGYYVVMGNVMAIGVPDGKRVTAMIIKNGEPVSYGTTVNQGADGLLSSIASDLIYMNGTTDCLELWAQNTSSSALALLTGDSNMNYISVLGPF